MMNAHMSPIIRSVMAASCTTALLFTAACGTASSDGSGVGSEAVEITAEDMQKALNDTSKKVKLTFWTSSYDAMKASVSAFQKKYPHITVDFVNIGASGDLLTKFQNAVTAKKNIPDVVQFGYDNYEQFAASGSLLNFASDSIEKEIGDRYISATWDAVHYADGLYGIPQDQAPIAMYSRTDILQQHGLKVPTTWDEFYEEGKKLHEADSSKYMGFIDKNATKQWSTWYRQAGVKLWDVPSATSVSLNMNSDSVKTVSDFLQKCIDDGVLEPVATGTDEFNRDIGEGRYATWIDENWRGNLIKQQYPDLSGKYTVTLPPAWGTSTDDLKTASGGSMLAIANAIPVEKRAAAIAFANWLNSDQESIDMFQKSNGSFFLAAHAYQDAAKNATQVDPYFNTDADKVYFESAALVNGDWTYLPFLSQLDSYYADIVAPELKPQGNLDDTLARFQAKVKDYASGQGYTVKE